LWHIKIADEIYTILKDLSVEKEIDRKATLALQAPPRCVEIAAHP